MSNDPLPDALTTTSANNAPSAPSINSPAFMSNVATATPVLSVNNSSDQDKDPLTYEFEIYSNLNLTPPALASVNQVTEGTAITSWQIDTTLQEEDTWYSWRARAFDGLAYSEWMEEASFMVNADNKGQQRIPLSAGWNLISFQVKKCFYDQAVPTTVFIPSGVEMEEKESLSSWLSDDLASPLRDADDPGKAGDWQRIISFDIDNAHVLDKELPSFINTLHYLSFGYGYWIKMNKPGVLIVHGDLASSDIPLELKAGWNLIGSVSPAICYGRNPMSMEDLYPYKTGIYGQEEGIIYCPLDSFMETVLVSVSGKYRRVISFDPLNGAMLHDTGIPLFIDTLHYFGPKYGYWIKINEAGKITFPAGCP